LHLYAILRTDTAFGSAAARQRYRAGRFQAGSHRDKFNEYPLAKMGVRLRMRLAVGWAHVVQQFGHQRRPYYFSRQFQNFVTLLVTPLVKKVSLVGQEFAVPLRRT
jgi:hypothetical protein